MSKPRRRAAMGFIFVTVLLDMISMGIMIPVLPNLIREMVGGSFAVATIWTGVFATSWGLMQFVFSPIQGMLSDRYGRRTVLLISIFGLSLDYLFMALAPSLWILFIGRIINGATAASFSTAGAYIADVSKPEDRAKNFGIIGAAFGLGFIIGPFVGGQLGELHIRLPFYVAFAMGFLNWMYGFFILPESLPKERREPRFNWAKANPLGSLKLLRRHDDLLGMAGVYGLFQLAHNVLPSVAVLYMGQRYGWSIGQTGLVLMAVGLANVVAQAALVGPAVKRFGERGILLFGLLAEFVGMAIFGLAPNGLIFLLGIPVMACSAFIGPGLQGLMTRRVEPWEQGQLQGANSAIMGIMAMIGPQIFTNIFAFSILYNGPVNLHGLPMYLSALFGLSAFLLAVRVAKPETPAPTVPL